MVPPGSHGTEISQLTVLCDEFQAPARVWIRPVRGSAVTFPQAEPAPGPNVRLQPGKSHHHCAPAWADSAPPPVSVSVELKSCVTRSPPYA